MSNSFPKVSPMALDRLLKSRNAQLMRPDSQLYIVPAEARSKAFALQYAADELLAQLFAQRALAGLLLEERSPYTQMFLTHLDAEETPVRRS